VHDFSELVFHGTVFLVVWHFVWNSPIAIIPKNEAIDSKSERTRAVYSILTISARLT